MPHVMIQRDVGGEIEWRLPSRPDGAPNAPTADIYSDRNDHKVTAGATTTDSVDTTLAAAAAAGATSLAVTSATGIVEGRQYRIAASTSGPAEWVRVRSISGTTLTIAPALTRAHAAGAAFQGTRVTYTVAGTAADRLGSNWRAVLTWYSGGTRQNDSITTFDVGLYPLRSSLRWPDVATFDPWLQRRLPADYDWEGAIDDAWDELMLHLGPRIRPGLMIGDSELRIPHRFLLLQRAAVLFGGDRGRDLIEHYGKLYTDALQKVAGAVGLDEDADGVLQAHERGRSGGRLLRA